MPCRDYDYSDIRNMNEDNAVKAKLDKMSRMMCTVMTQLLEHRKPTHDFIVNNNKEIAEWWAKHQEQDKQAALELKKRKQIRQAKKVALAKLTLEERKLLKL